MSFPAVRPLSTPLGTGAHAVAVAVALVVAFAIVSGSRPARPLWRDRLRRRRSCHGRPPLLPCGSRATKLIDGDGNPVRLIGVDHSGGQTACVSGEGYFDPPNADTPSMIAAMLSWHINAVRLPLNEDCWLGINLPYPQLGGAGYRAAVIHYVDDPYERRRIGGDPRPRPGSPGLADGVRFRRHGGRGSCPELLAFGSQQLQGQPGRGVRSLQRAAVLADHVRRPGGLCRRRVPGRGVRPAHRRRPVHRGDQCDHGGGDGLRGRPARVLEGHAQRPPWAAGHLGARLQLQRRPRPGDLGPLAQVDGAGAVRDG